MNGVATYTHQHTTNKSSATKTAIVNIVSNTKTNGIEPNERKDTNLELATSKAQETKTSTKNTRYCKKK